MQTNFLGGIKSQVMTPVRANVLNLMSCDGLVGSAHIITSQLHCARVTPRKLAKSDERKLILHSVSAQAADVA